jgi:hypothetical protein
MGVTARYKNESDGDEHWDEQRPRASADAWRASCGRADPTVRVCVPDPREHAREDHAAPADKERVEPPIAPFLAQSFVMTFCHSAIHERYIGTERPSIMPA